MNEFDNINGFLIDKGEKVFNPGNRSYKYGDGIFETIKVVEGKIQFWNDHYDRLKRGIEVLKLDDSNFSKDKWFQEIERVVYKNYYKYAKIRLSVYRDAPGLYTPNGNRIGFAVEGVRFDKGDFTFKPEGIVVGLYEEIKLSIDALSNAKTASALPYVMASIYKKEQGLDDVLLFNQEGNIAESANSNVFLVKDGKIFTPALTQGCIAGVMRKNVLLHCHLHKIDVEERAISLEEIKSADEIFLTNVIAGVQGVKSILEIEKQQILTHKIQGFFQ